MAVHFLAERCNELRKGFGMDGILVGSRGNGGALNGGNGGGGAHGGPGFGSVFGGDSTRAAAGGGGGHGEDGGAAAAEKAAAKAKADRRKSAAGCLSPGGLPLDGQRWSGVTVDVTEVGPGRCRSPLYPRLYRAHIKTQHALFKS
jgi:hypothetical protein